MKLTRPLLGASTRGRPRRAPALVGAAAALAVGIVAVAGSPATAAVAAAPAGIDRVVSLSGTIDGTCGSGIPAGTPVHTSIQAAVNASGANSQIYICAGTYTENVNINVDSVSLIGPNWNDPTGSSDVARINAAAAGSPVVNFTTASPNNGGVRGLTLSGGSYGVRSQATSGGSWDDANLEGIRNNVILGSTVAGISTAGIDSGYITGNRITPASGADGIDLVDAQNWVIQSNTITTSGSAVGIDVGGANNSTGLQIGGSTASLGNTITGGTTGIRFADTTLGTVDVGSSTIQFNTVRDVSGNGIRFEGPVVNMNVLDNTVERPGASGISVANAGTQNAGNYNFFRNTVTSPGLDGITLDGRIAYCYCGNNGAGNTITDAGRNGITATGFVVTAGPQAARVFSLQHMRFDDNTITNPAADGIQTDGINTLYTNFNEISGAGDDGMDISRADSVQVVSNTVTGSTDDGIIYNDAVSLSIATNTITGNGGDGLQLNANTGNASVSGNTITGNAAGIRVTSPTVTYPSAFANNNVSLNTGYGCEDQSSGSISNPPAVGTQGNDWDPSNTGAALQSPAGICGAVLTATGGLDDGVVGTAYADAVAASGAPGPYTWYSTQLPAGLTLDAATGAITGTPTQAVSEWPIVFWVRSAGGAWGQVSEAITITTASGMTADATLPDGTLGTAYSSPAPTVSGGTGPYTWSATGLPAGLSIDPATGVVSGTPTVAVADQPVTITVVDSTGQSVDVPLTITILPDTSGVPLVDPMVGAMAAGFAGLVLLSMRARRRQHLA